MSVSTSQSAIHVSHLLAAAASIFGGGMVRPPFCAVESVVDDEGAFDEPPTRVKKFIPNPFLGARNFIISSSPGNCRLHERIPGAALAQIWSANAAISMSTPHVEHLIVGRRLSCLPPGAMHVIPAHSGALLSGNRIYSDAVEFAECGRMSMCTRWCKSTRENGSNFARISAGRTTGR